MNLPEIFVDRIAVGHVLDALRALPDESIHCAVTSPPYWGLRDYGIEPKIWGGDVQCRHEWGEQRIVPRDSNRDQMEWTTGGDPARKIKAGPVSQRSFCIRCGAWRGSLGLEPSPELYVEHIVEVFREVRRVLRKDGTLFLDIGDCFVSGGRSQWDLSSNNRNHNHLHGSRPANPKGLKPKDLVGIPWRVAFALQADGWWLRSDIIWEKPAPMPESVRDRPTRAHEYVFLLAKSESYFYDAEAITEPASEGTHLRISQATLGRQEGGRRQNLYEEDAPGRQRHDRRPSDIVKALAAKAGVNPKAAAAPDGVKQNASFSAAIVAPALRRNKRTVWTIPHEPFNGVVFYGTYRIGSTTCPAHGHQAFLVPALKDGVLRGVSVIPRNLGIGVRPDPAQEGDVYAIRSDQVEHLEDAIAAKNHSNAFRRMAAGLMRDDSCDGKSVDDSVCSEPSPRSSANGDHMSANNTEADSCGDEIAHDPLEETCAHILCIASFEPRDPSCRCQYIGRTEKRQDHFAVFPEALVEPCVLAGTSERGCCPACGAPWRRIVERRGGTTGKSWHDHSDDLVKGQRANAEPSRAFESGDYVRETVGWEPGCKCPEAAAPVPCVVLDPFMGAGTTALVALKLGRRFAGAELNPLYAAMAEWRIAPERAQLKLF